MAGFRWSLTKALVLVALLFAWGAGKAAVAQASAASNGGAIAGRLTDLHSTPLAGATVVVRNEATGAESRTTTARNGSYRFNGLDPGQYTLEAESDQLGRGRLEGIFVSAGHEAHVQAAMAFETPAPHSVQTASTPLLQGRPAPIIQSESAPASQTALTPANQPALKPSPQIATAPIAHPAPALIAEPVSRPAIQPPPKPAIEPTRNPETQAIFLSPANAENLPLVEKAASSSVSTAFHAQIRNQAPAVATVTPILTTSVPAEPLLRNPRFFPTRGLATCALNRR